MKFELAFQKMREGKLIFEPHSFQDGIYLKIFRFDSKFQNAAYMLTFCDKYGVNLSSYVSADHITFDEMLSENWEAIDHQAG